jgi:hypothetical protein
LRIGGDTHPGGIIKINPVRLHAFNVPLPKKRADICSKAENHIASFDNSEFNDVVCGLLRNLTTDHMRRIRHRHTGPFLKRNIGVAQDLNVITKKADWLNQDGVIATMLQTRQRVFDPGAKPGSA